MVSSQLYDCIQCQACCILHMDIIHHPLSPDTIHTYTIDTVYGNITYHRDNNYGLDTMASFTHSSHQTLQNAEKVHWSNVSSILFIFSCRKSIFVKQIKPNQTAVLLQGVEPVEWSLLCMQASQGCENHTLVISMISVCPRLFYSPCS